MASKAQRQRKRWVKAAHAMGLTLRGYKYWRGGGERAMAERTSRSLQKQADREMKRAYAPVERGFTQREQQIAALDAKRAADEQAFQSWLGQTQAAIQQNAINQQSQLLTQAGQHRKDLADAIAKIGQQSPGMGGEPAQTSDLVTATAGAVAAEGSRRYDELVGRQQRSTDQTGASAANNLAFAAAKTAERQAKTYDLLTELADEKQKATLQRAADSSRRVAQLLDQELSKAQARVAGAQFSTKELNDLADAAAGRATTRAGQRGTQQRWADTVNKYGYSNAQWKRFSPSHRKRIIKKFEKEQGKGKKKGESPTNARQRAGARSQIRDGVGRINGNPPIKDGQRLPMPPMILTKKNELAYSRWLQKHWGWSKNYADLVIWHHLYPKHKGKLPPGIQRRFNEFAAGLPS